jgi:hypothetical protein
MREWQSLAHVKWECKYHVVIVPKYRHKVLFGRLRKNVGKIIRQLCRQKEVDIVEGHCVSTICLDEKMIRAYVRNQEKLDEQEDLNFNP